VGRVAPLSAAQRRTLAGLKHAGLLDDVYLAGGVAVATHVGHRRSIDLDLFSRRPALDLVALQDRMRSLDAEVVAMTDATLTVQLGGVPVDFVCYPYEPLVRLGVGPEGVRVASPRDLAAMKLAAIARRGIRRDFWDLYELLKRRPGNLRRALDDYRLKFGVSQVDTYQVLRALSWFEDAERDVIRPRGMSASRWREIREWFELAVASELKRRRD
jgi:hypothetical protein